MEIEETLDKDLCVVTPEWNKIIHESERIEDLIRVRRVGYGSKRYNADLAVSSCCFVGEAWDWTSDYMGVVLRRHIVGEGRASKSFLAHARDFIAHFKQEHQDRYINKVNTNRSLCGQEQSL